MLSVYEIRRLNLRRLMSEWGGPASLARKLGHANGSYLAQLAGPNPSRDLSERTAREIESKLGLPSNWLDSEHQGQVRVDDEALASCVKAVAAALRDAGLRPDPDKYSILVGLVYDRWRTIGRLEEPYVNKLIDLMR